MTTHGPSCANTARRTAGWANDACRPGCRCCSGGVLAWQQHRAGRRMGATACRRACQSICMLHEQRGSGYTDSWAHRRNARNGNGNGMQERSALGEQSATEAGAGEQGWQQHLSKQRGARPRRCATARRKTRKQGESRGKHGKGAKAERARSKSKSTVDYRVPRCSRARRRRRRLLLWRLRCLDAQRVDFWHEMLYSSLDRLVPRQPPLPRKGLADHSHLEAGAAPGEAGRTCHRHE